jgi:hypothetical protein
MDNQADKRQQLIAAMLAMPDDVPPAIRSARMLAPWRTLATHFSPLVGETGFGALFGRALRLCGPEHAWLGGTAPSSVAALLTALDEKLAAADPAQAAQGNAALLTAYITLLSAMIGEALTTRLLDSAWAAGPSGKHAGSTNK